MNTKPITWWDDDGPDTCEGCETAYYTEVGYYCSDCDRGVCTGCVAYVETGVLLCEQCHNERSKNVQKENANDRSRNVES